MLVLLQKQLFKFVTMKQLERCKVSLCLELTVGKKLNGDFWNVNAADKKLLTWQNHSKWDTTGGSDRQEKH